MTTILIITKTIDGEPFLGFLRHIRCNDNRKKKVSIEIWTTTEISFSSERKLSPLQYFRLYPYFFPLMIIWLKILIIFNPNKKSVCCYPMTNHISCTINSKWILGEWGSFSLKLKKQNNFSIRCKLRFRSFGIGVSMSLHTNCFFSFFTKSGDKIK